MRNECNVICLQYTKHKTLEMSWLFVLIITKHIHWLDYSYILILLQLLTHLSFNCNGGCVLLLNESGITNDDDWCIKALWVALWDSQFNLKHSCEQKYVLIPFSVHLGHKNEALSLVQPLPEQNRFFSFLFLGIVGGRSWCWCGGGLIRS